MTRTTNARIAGFTYLFYIAVAFPSLVLFNRATGGEGTAAKLVSVAQHATDVRVAILLTLASSFTAVVLAVALYGITRTEDHELAVLAMLCRVCEGLLGAISIEAMVNLRWLTTASARSGGPDTATANVLAAFLLMPGAGMLVPATFFAVGSTIFCYLLLRGRMVPIPLAWLGVLASASLVVILPLQLAGWLKDLAFWYQWMPILVFELTVALWLLIKGVKVAPLAAAVS